MGGFMRAKILVPCAVALILAVGHPASAQHSNAASSVRLPDFAGRDKQFAYLILAAMKEGANFAGHYTILTIGCGTGCTYNLILDRKTGAVGELPYGGEQQQQLKLRYGLKSNLLGATWFDGDLCVEQQAKWNGMAFEISNSPSGRPEEVCRG